MHTCVSQRPKRPQLSDTINRLDEMIETLSTAIPGAVSESVREVLGASLVAAIGDAVREAVKVGVREGVQAAVGEAVALATARSVSGQRPDRGGTSRTWHYSHGAGRLGPYPCSDRRTPALGNPSRGTCCRTTDHRMGDREARLQLDHPFPVGGTLDCTGRCRSWLHGVRGRPDKFRHSAGPRGRGDYCDSGLGSPTRVPAHGVARRLGRWPNAG